LKHKVEITLPTVPYDHNLKDIISYLQTVVSQLTGTNAELYLNDYDFTSVSSVWNKTRRDSHPKRIIKEQ
tara:strand:- start:124 stop:333 length:210 start_codon:yes stop_codon:yes gene_type:complete